MRRHSANPCCALCWQMMTMICVTSWCRLPVLYSFQIVPSSRAVFADARAAAINADWSIHARQRAIRLLAYAPFEMLAETSELLIDVRQPPEIQLAAIQALSATDESLVASTLLRNWKAYTPSVKECCSRCDLGAYQPARSAFGRLGEGIHFTRQSQHGWSPAIAGKSGRGNSAARRVAAVTTKKWQPV